MLASLNRSSIRTHSAGVALSTSTFQVESSTNCFTNFGGAISCLRKSTRMGGRWRRSPEKPVSYEAQPGQYLKIKQQSAVVIGPRINSIEREAFTASIVGDAFT